MRTTLLTTSSLLALIPFTLSQTLAVPGASTTNDQPAPTGTSSANVDAVVSFLLPDVGPTSFSPSQSTAILSVASSVLSSYTSASPLSSLQNEIVGPDLIFAGTLPNPSERAELSSLLAAATTALVNDPAAFSQSVESVISPFAFASVIRSYEEGFSADLATAVASQLSVSPPPAPAQTTASEGKAPKPRPTAGVGAAGVAAAGVAAGVVGMLL